jgi:arylsulfatase A-like enzyme
MTYLTRIAFCLFVCIVASSLHAADRPNIIFFLSDDHRSDMLGCAGHPILKTPAIDALAKQGVRFENMFVTTSICAATRATLFTGLYERSHRFTFGTPPISESHAAASYPSVLHKSGYRTGFVGKFGVSMAGKQRQAMFDYFRPLGRSPSSSDSATDRSGTSLRSLATTRLRFSRPTRKTNRSVYRSVSTHRTPKMATRRITFPGPRRLMGSTTTSRCPPQSYPPRASFTVSRNFCASR